MTPDQIKTAGAAELDKLAAEARGLYIESVDNGISCDDYYCIPEHEMPGTHRVRREVSQVAFWHPSSDHGQAHELIQHGIDTRGENAYLFVDTYAAILYDIVIGKEHPLSPVTFANVVTKAKAVHKTRAYLLAICELEGGE